MSGGEVDADPDDGAVQAACREYQHQRECIVHYLIDCGAVTEDKSAGGLLTEPDHCGSEVDTFTIVDATRAFLAVSDVRMHDGSADERIALAVLVTQYRRLLPISPLTTTLAEAAGRAVKAAKNDGAEDARGGKAALDDARTAARRSIIAPLYQDIRQEAEARGEKFSFKLLLSIVDDALATAAAAGQLPPPRREERNWPRISEATLRRDVAVLLNPTR